MLMIKLCVFDMDGLLIDSERQMYAKTGYDVSRILNRPIDMDFLTAQMGGSFKAYEEHLLERYGADYPLEEYWKMYWGRVNDTVYNVPIPLRPGVKKILDYCKDKGIKMAIASSSKHYVINSCLKNSGIKEYFDHTVSVEDVSNTKPDPEIFLKAIEHFNVDKSEALIFEDGHNGAQAAINGGLRLIIVEDLAYISEEDRAKAEMVTDDISKTIEYIEKENERTTGI